MIIDYHLTEYEYDLLWNMAADTGDVETLLSKYHITYSENSIVDAPGFWGTLTGEQKYITLILLQL